MQVIFYLSLIIISIFIQIHSLGSPTQWPLSGSPLRNGPVLRLLRPLVIHDPQQHLVSLQEQHAQEAFGVGSHQAHDLIHVGIWHLHSLGVEFA